MVDVDITQEIQAPPARSSAGAERRTKTTGLLRKWSVTPQEQQLISEYLTWVAQHFNVSRARIVRQVFDGTWIVQTVIEGNAVAQQADRAEIAMAWLVALSGGPVRVAKPRVTTNDGTGVRPIAMTTYLGLPVYSRQRLAGVVEVAGDIANLPKSSIKIAAERLSGFGNRLCNDPSLRAPQLLTPDTECSLGGGMPCGDAIQLTAAEWTFVTAIRREDSITELARRLNLELAEAISLAQSLAERGAIQASIPNQLLSNSTTA